MYLRASSDLEGLTDTVYSPPHLSVPLLKFVTHANSTSLIHDKLQLELFIVQPILIHRRGSSIMRHLYSWKDPKLKRPCEGGQSYLNPVITSCNRWSELANVSMKLGLSLTFLHKIISSKHFLQRVKTCEIFIDQHKSLRLSSTSPPLSFPDMSDDLILLRSSHFSFVPEAVCSDWIISLNLHSRVEDESHGCWAKFSVCLKISVTLTRVWMWNCPFCLCVSFSPGQAGDELTVKLKVGDKWQRHSYGTEAEGQLEKKD